MTYIEQITYRRPKRHEDMAASISSMILQLRKDSIKQSLSDLDLVGHRQDLIATIDGVMYYDDSKAESVNATWFTLDNIVSSVIWIAGGNDKNANFGELKNVARKNVRALICIGKNSKRLASTFSCTVTDIYQADNLEEAVKMASMMARKNDVVLFSPACPSDSLKEDFEMRGDRFITSVKQLQDEHNQ